MDIQRIACEILHVEDIALTRKQADYLKAEISNLPDIEQKALESDKFANNDKEQTAARFRAISRLRANKKLVTILNLSIMPHNLLINVMIDVITDDNEDKEHGMEVVSKPEDAPKQPSSIPEPPVAEEAQGCYLKALFGAIIAGRDEIYTVPYQHALCILQQNDTSIIKARGSNYYSSNGVLDNRCVGALRNGGIHTNADLIRWRKSRTSHIRGIGKKCLAEIDTYLDFWFSSEKQHLLSSVVPL